MSVGSKSPQYTQGHDDLRGGAKRERTCRYCDDGFERGFNEEYCSRQCKYNGIAYDALRRIRHDHTHCVSCFRKLKILIPPGRHHCDTSQLEEPRTVDTLSKDIPSYGPPDYPRALDLGGVVSLEKSEPCHFWDVGEEFRPDRSGDGWEFKPAGQKSTKVCECGVSHHATVAYGDDQLDAGCNFRADLTVAEAIERVERLVDVLEEWQATDQWCHEFDENALFEAVRDLKTRPKIAGQGKDFEIFERSLGIAIQRAEA